MVPKIRSIHYPLSSPKEEDTSADTMSSMSAPPSDQSRLSHSSANSKSTADFTSLEFLAETLEQQLYEQNLVQDRNSVLRKTIPKSFKGSDVVSIIHEILRQRDADDDLDGADEFGGDPFSAVATSEISREEALSIGNQIAQEYEFIVHATKANGELIDSKKELYQFHNNLPIQVSRAKKKYKSYWDKMKVIEANADVKDRWHMFRMFPQCFIARDLVDTVMNLKLVRSRREGVHLIRKLNQKVFCCEHVCIEHEFQDEYLFFRFIPVSQRMREPVLVEKPSLKSHRRRKAKGRRQVKTKQARSPPAPSSMGVSSSETPASITTLALSASTATDSQTPTSTSRQSVASIVAKPILLQDNKSESASNKVNTINSMIFRTENIASLPRQEDLTPPTATSVAQDGSKGKALYQQRANMIRNRLASHKQEVMIRKRRTATSMSSQLSNTIALPRRNSRNSLDM